MGTWCLMTTIRAKAAGYYSTQEALKAAAQLIELLQREHERGFFQLEDVVLRNKETDLIFTGAEYLAFARRGVQEALDRTSAGGHNSPVPP
jgi:hypothetical protein